MKRKWMETAVVWLLVIGPLLIGLGAAIWWGSGNNTVGLWGGFVPGAIALVLAAAFQIQTLISKAEDHGTVIAKPDSPDRPWISLDIELAGPLAYDAAGWDAGLRWHIPIRFKLTNTGNSPATGVDAHADIRPFTIGYWPPGRIKDGIPQGEPIPGTNVVTELKALCETQAAMRKHLGSFMGQTIFKGRTFEGLFHLNANPAMFDAARQSPGFSGNLLILMCVSYKSPTDDRLHQTGESFAVFITNAKIDLNGGSIPAEKLRLTSQPMGGNFAN
jgi:hypothetical protein